MERRAAQEERRTGVRWLVGGGCSDEGVAHFGKVVSKVPVHRLTDAVDRLLALYRDNREGDEELGAFFRRVPPSLATDALKDVHLRHAVPVILGYSSMAASAGAVPVPFLDLLLLPGIQSRMVTHLARVYRKLGIASRAELGPAIGLIDDTYTVDP